MKHRIMGYTLKNRYKNRSINVTSERFLTLLEKCEDYSWYWSIELFDNKYFQQSMYIELSDRDSMLFKLYWGDNDVICN